MQFKPYLFVTGIWISTFEEFSQVFSKMSDLRLLMIARKHRIPNYQRHLVVPNELRLLSWEYCPLKRLVSSFQPKELV